MNCQGIGRILGHKYEARYDASPSGGMDFERCSANEVVRIIEANSIKVYKGDVCTRCGHIVNSPKEQA